MSKPPNPQLVGSGPAAGLRSDPWGRADDSDRSLPWIVFARPSVRVTCDPSCIAPLTLRNLILAGVDLTWPRRLEFRQVHGSKFDKNTEIFMYASCRRRSLQRCCCVNCVPALSFSHSLVLWTNQHLAQASGTARPCLVSGRAGQMSSAAGPGSGGCYSKDPNGG